MTSSLPDIRPPAAHGRREAATAGWDERWMADAPEVAVRREIEAILWPFLTASVLATAGDLDVMLDELVPVCVEDLLAMSRADPAAGGSWRQVLGAYCSYRAVLTYRIAHCLLMGSALQPPEVAEVLAAMTRRLTEGAKVSTGIEIHPAAIIGRRFVLDHGVGTVIGETTVIGDDCYVLQSVVLGAVGIASNPNGKRHPTLGDRVQVAGFARVLGPVTIGDDAVIAPHCVVTVDVPAGCRVTIVNQCQVCTATSPVRVSALLLEGDRLEIRGSGLADSALRVAITDALGRELPNLGVDLLVRRDDRICFELRVAGPVELVGLRVALHGPDATVVLTDPIALVEALRRQHALVGPAPDLSMVEAGAL